MQDSFIHFRLFLFVLTLNISILFKVNRNTENVENYDSLKDSNISRIVSLQPMSNHGSPLGLSNV